MVLWALLLAPESVFSNGPFSLRCAAVPPCTLAFIGLLQLQAEETPTLLAEFPVSQMRELEVGRAGPRPTAL